MSTLFYCIRQGLSNFCKNLLFSIASVATVAACIFLFCVFYALTMNVQHMAYQAETTVGITVFFNEDASPELKNSFRDSVISHGGVKTVNYISADEAWSKFQTEYFGDKADELAAAFEDDNPLKNSDSYEIFMENIEDQQDMVEYIRTLPGVREVNYSNVVISALRKLNKGISVLSAVIIGVLFAISVFLISNTINVAATFRKRENEIMKLIGATNFMIRAPFVVEGTFIGFLGAAIPLAGIYFIYNKLVSYLAKQVSSIGGSGAISELLHMIPFSDIFPVMLGAGLILGAGMGFIVSALTIRKHLKV